MDFHNKLHACIAIYGGYYIINKTKGIGIEIYR